MEKKNSRQNGATDYIVVRHFENRITKEEMVSNIIKRHIAVLGASEKGGK